MIVTATDRPVESLPTLGFRDEHDTATLGTWWWDAQLLVRANEATGLDAQKGLEMLRLNRVTEIYLCVGASVMLDQTGREAPDVLNARKLASFIRRCSAYGMRVSALTGVGGADALNWIDPKGGYVQTSSYIEAVRKYNDAVLPEERFYAVHLDVEPHGAERAACNQMMADYVAAMRPLCDANGLQLEIDINAWYRADDLVTNQDGERVPIMDVLSKCCHSIGIMSYRPSASQQMEIASYELESARVNGCHMVVGSETMREEDLGDEGFISYSTVGIRQMAAEQKKLRQMLRETGYENVGAAIHWLNSWYCLAQLDY